MRSCYAQGEPNSQAKLASFFEFQPPYFKQYNDLTNIKDVYFNSSYGGGPLYNPILIESMSKNPLTTPLKDDIYKPTNVYLYYMWKL